MLPHHQSSTSSWHRQQQPDKALDSPPPQRKISVDSPPPGPQPQQHPAYFFFSALSSSLPLPPPPLVHPTALFPLNKTYDDYYDTEEFDEWHLQHLLALAKLPFCSVTQKFICPPPSTSTKCGGDPDPRPLMMAAVPPPTAQPALPAAFAAGPLLQQQPLHQPPPSQLKPRRQPPTQPQQEEVLLPSSTSRSRSRRQHDDDDADVPLHSFTQSLAGVGAGTSIGTGTGAGTWAEDNRAASFIHLEEVDDDDNASMSEQDDEIEDVTPSPNTPGPGGCVSASATETRSAAAMVAIQPAAATGWAWVARDSYGNLIADENRTIAMSLFYDATDPHPTSKTSSSSSSVINKVMTCRNCGAQIVFRQTKSLLSHAATTPCVIRRIERSIVRGDNTTGGQLTVNSTTKGREALEALSRTPTVTRAVRDLWSRHFVRLEAAPDGDEGTGRRGGGRGDRRHFGYCCRHCSRPQSQANASRHLTACLGIAAVIRALEEVLIPIVSAALLVEEEEDHGDHRSASAVSRRVTDRVPRVSL